MAESRVFQMNEAALHPAMTRYVNIAVAAGTWMKMIRSLALLEVGQGDDEADGQPGDGQRGGQPSEHRPAGRRG